MVIKLTFFSVYLLSLRHLLAIFLIFDWAVVHMDDIFVKVFVEGIPV